MTTIKNLAFRYMNLGGIPIFIQSVLDGIFSFIWDHSIYLHRTLIVLHSDDGTSIIIYSFTISMFLYSLFFPIFVLELESWSLCMLSNYITSEYISSSWFIKDMVLLLTQNWLCKLNVAQGGLRVTVTLPQPYPDLIILVTVVS